MIIRLQFSNKSQNLFHIVFIIIIAAIHCEWDEWSVGECSKTCGTGTRNNFRTKLVVEEHGGTCTGEPSEIEECNTQGCPGMLSISETNRELHLTTRKHFYSCLVPEIDIQLCKNGNKINAF